MCESGGGGNTASAEKLYATQAQISQEQWDNWKSSFKPLETKTIADVQALSDPGRIEQRVGLARQDVAGAFTTARHRQQRELQGFGLNPSDGMYGAASRQIGLAEAGATAGASNRARDAAKTEALNAQMGLISTGRGLANSAQAGLSSAASGFAGLGNAQAQAAAQSNAGTGAAVGTAVMAAAMMY